MMSSRRLRNRPSSCFYYKSEDIDNSKQVDIQVKNRQVTDVLNELLQKHELDLPHIR